MRSRATAQDQLKAFLASKRWPYYRWICDFSIRVYVRQSKRMFDRGVEKVLDIVSVKVDPRLVGTGVWAAFIKYAEELVLADDEMSGIFVENVINHKLALGLEKHGYKRTQEGSYFRRIQ